MNTYLRSRWRRPLGLALILGLLLSLVLPLAVQVAAAQTSPTAVVTSPRLHIRTGPGASYASITTIGQGERVILLGRDSASAWAKNSTGTDVEGWASTAFLDTGGALRSLPVLERVQPQVAVAPFRLNVRNAPASNATVVATLIQGEIVNILGRSSNSAWVYINYGGGSQGWIASGEFTPRISLAGLPVIAAPAVPTPVPGAPTAPPLARGITGQARAGSIRVNTAAGNDHGTITHLREGEQVQILGRAAELPWYYIFFRGNTLGWVDSANIVTSASQASIPIVPQTLPVGENQTPPATGGPPTTPTGPTATVITGRLNVRSGAGAGYPVVDVVSRGDVLPIVGRDSASKWLQVRTPSGRIGWVNGDFTRKAGNVGQAPVESPSQQTAIVEAGALNVRSGPGPEHNAIATIPRNTVVTIVERQANWARIIAGDVNGWVDTGFLRLVR